MSDHYGTIAFTDNVRDAQTCYGSRAFYDRKRAKGTSPDPDPLNATEREFLAEQDGFYLATVSETGWPYVQYRGGPAGFLHVIDDHTVGWADFRGNLQYISTGNLAGDDRVAIIVMDYAHRRRLKLFGRAHVIAAEDRRELFDALTDPSYDAKVQRAVLITIEAFDWNCPQHITPRFTAIQIETHAAALNRQLSALRAENSMLRGLIETADQPNS
jgi:predicted pyridoxine 5'-phosphate oxidase superfamily flavin-nucleotide-binding protein